MPLNFLGVPAVHPNRYGSVIDRRDGHIAPESPGWNGRAVRRQGGLEGCVKSISFLRRRRAGKIRTVSASPIGDRGGLTGPRDIAADIAERAIHLSFFIRENARCADFCGQ